MKNLRENFIRADKTLLTTNRKILNAFDI